MSDDNSCEFGSLKTTKKTVLEWRVDKINALLAAAKAGEERTVEKPSSEFTEQWASVYVYAVPLKADYHNSTSSQTWLRDGKWNFNFEFFADDCKQAVSSFSDTAIEFSSEEPGWGGTKAIHWHHLESAPIKDKNVLIIRCSLESDYIEPLPPFSDYKTLVGLFKSPDYADVAFEIESANDGQPVFLFATRLVLHDRSSHFRTMLQSGMSEATKRVGLNVKAHLARYIKHPQKGDKDEFAPFVQLLLPEAKAADEENAVKKLAEPLAQATVPAASLKEEPAGVAPSSVQEGAASDSASKPTSTEEVPMPAEPAPGAVPKKPQQPSAAAGRRLMHVKIEDCSYETFRALLKHMHDGAVHFLPSFATYLVYRQSFMPSPANEAPISLAMWENAHNDEWFQHRSSPHAVYRLADRYFVHSLKDIARKAIVRFLTPETAAYELFSQLSMDFTDVQKPILDYVHDNWDKVSSTSAMKTALELVGAGQLPGGAAVIGKLFLGLQKKAVVKDAAQDGAAQP
ncbi:hypothetical protein JCM10207_005623 [Rhodosporidiobolus poonsookiae]